MKKTRVALLGATHMTAIERRMGRFMRAPDHDAGTGGGENNNSRESAAGGNNNGEADPLAAFWGSNEESSEGDGNDGNSGDSGQTPNFLEAINNMPVAGIFTDSALEKLGNGDYSEINTNLESTIRQASQQQFAQTVQLLNLFGERLVATMEQRFSGTLEQRDSSAFLEQNFPSAKDPKIRPMVENVFNQAMKNTKGNRAEAIKQTKEMLALLGKQTAADTGLPLDTSGDSSASGKNNWLQKLTSQLSQ